MSEKTWAANFDWFVYLWHLSLWLAVFALARGRRTRLALLLFAAALLLTLACAPRPLDIQLSEGDLRGHWIELERRVPAWFRSLGLPVPVLPPREEVLSRVRFLELPAGEGCYFDPDAWIIKVAADDWASGCVPHELGHAALRVLDHPCKSWFEHERDAERCREALR